VLLASSYYGIRYRIREILHEAGIDPPRLRRDPQWTASAVQLRLAVVVVAWRTLTRGRLCGQACPSRRVQHFSPRPSRPLAALPESSSTPSTRAFRRQLGRSATRVRTGRPGIGGAVARGAGSRSHARRSGGRMACRTHRTGLDIGRGEPCSARWRPAGCSSGPPSRDVPRSVIKTVRIHSGLTWDYQGGHSRVARRHRVLFIVTGSSWLFAIYNGGL
jgi:hypothetical protein